MPQCSGSSSRFTQLAPGVTLEQSEPPEKHALASGGGVGGVGGVASGAPGVPGGAASLEPDTSSTGAMVSASADSEPAP